MLVAVIAPTVNPTSFVVSTPFSGSRAPNKKATGHLPVAFRVLIATGSVPPVASDVVLARGCSGRARQRQQNQTQYRYAREHPGHGRGVYGLVTASSSTLASTAPRPARRRTEDERLDRDDVIEHRLMCRGAVAPLDRSQDPEMVLVRARGTPGRVEGFLAALGEQVHQRVRDPRDRAVVRGGPDRCVKRGVLREARLAGADLARLVVENPLHLLDFLGRGPARRERRDGRLQDAPRLEELADRLALRRHHQGQRADQGVDRHLAHERPLARSDLHEPEALEGAERLAYGGAAHHELLGEVALGRQLVAALEPPFRDELLDLADDLLVDPGRLYRPELDRAALGF